MHAYVPYTGNGNGSTVGDPEQISGNQLVSKRANRSSPSQWGTWPLCAPSLAPEPTMTLEKLLLGARQFRSFY